MLRQPLIKVAGTYPVFPEITQLILEPPFMNSFHHFMAESGWVRLQDTLSCVNASMRNPRFGEPVPNPIKCLFTSFGALMCNAEKEDVYLYAIREGMRDWHLHLADPGIPGALQHVYVPAHWAKSILTFACWGIVKVVHDDNRFVAHYRNEMCQLVQRDLSTYTWSPCGAKFW